jgi:hypothetical protein
LRALPLIISSVKSVRARRPAPAPVHRHHRVAVDAGIPHDLALRHGVSFSYV